ncbi:hypothetical protein MMC21_008504 [Puttea exsequens]|nr:hypothetical protein [Puttea exsequens]
MQYSTHLPLIAACAAILASHVNAFPTRTSLPLAIRDNTPEPIQSGPGPAGIVCESEDGTDAHPAMPHGDGIVWSVTIPQASVPIGNGLPLAEVGQGTGSALHDSLRRKCGDGITYDTYYDWQGALAAYFTTPVTCRAGSVSNAIDSAFDRVRADKPHALCTDPPSGDDESGEGGASGLAGIISGIAEAIPHTK